MSRREQRADHLRRTLTELEHHDWGPPTYDSYLVTRVHALRHVPLGEFTVEDLRLMLGQCVGVRWLLPLALERIEEDPFVSGDFYPGDLLRNVIGCEADWPSDRATLARMRAVLQRALAEAPEDVTLDARSWRELSSEIEAAADRLRAREDGRHHA